MPKIEFREQLQPLSVKPLEGIIEGYPIVFNERTNIGDWFYEEIDPHALDDADLSDFIFLINHDNRNMPLARHRKNSNRSTMQFEIDDRGLAITASLDIENNMNSKMLCSAVERGDIEDMSFAFGIEVAGDTWTDIEAPMPIRRITKIRKVYEISAVNEGAYPQTSISARSSAALDDAKKMLDNIRAKLDNEKASDDEMLNLEKEKFLFIYGGN